MDELANIRKKPDEVAAKCDHPNEVVANCDHLQSLKFRPTLPYAFTEQGIGQLSTVVHSKIAIERSIVIMNAFVALLGASVKDMGVGMCAVTKMQVSPETVLQLLK